uniref:Uncharacterized protein n=1 Tax=Panagrolaimus sp. PS1159 TaxID=55785 RepID=A0AC35G986_9BILA
MKMLFPLVIPKIYKCDAKILSLENQIFSYSDFTFLASNAEKIYFEEVTLMNENGSIVPLENFFETLPKIKTFFYKCDTNLSNITLETENKSTPFHLDFGISISDTYKTRLEKIIDEFIEVGKFDYKIMISFFGLDIEKYRRLLELFF